jgi:hypothetical protein
MEGLSLGMLYHHSLQHLEDQSSEEVNYAHPYATTEHPAVAAWPAAPRE